jgi:UDP-glucose 4-epimerase
MAKVLVTGGAGFIGYYVSKLLADRGNDVFIADNFFRGKNDKAFAELIERKNVTFIECDLAEQSSYAKLGLNYDFVYHLAAINGTKYFYEIPEKILKTNVLSSVYILEWFIKSGSKKIAFASSSEAYAGTANQFGVDYPTPETVPLCIEDVFNPRWSYGGSKLAGELFFVNYAKAYDFPMVVLRYTNVYGPRMGNEHVVPEFATRLINKEAPFKIFGGEETRTFFYVEDAAEASVAALENASLTRDVVNIGAEGPEIKMTDLAKMMFEISGHNPEFAIQPAPEGCVKRRRANVEKMKKFYQPKVPLADGLKKTYDWYATNR